MHADAAQSGAVQPDVGEHRPARLERGQAEQMMLEHLDLLLHQQRVAVPADAAGADVELDRLVVAVRLDHRQREGARPRPEPPVGLLQRDDVGVELVQDVDRPLGPPPAVGPDRLAHVVGSDADHRPLL